MQNDDSSKDNNVDDDGCGNDDRKLPAKRDTNFVDDMPPIPEGDDDNDGGVDAFLSGYEEEVTANNGGGEDVDDQDDDVEGNDAGGGGEDEFAANGAGDNDANDGGGESVANAILVSEAVANMDPSSLFLHAKEDADSFLAFFADDSNYQDEGQREPTINVDNE